MHQVLLTRFGSCKDLGRVLYEVRGAVGSRALHTALCLSKSMLHARKQAAFLIFMMLDSQLWDVSTEMLRNGTGLSLMRLSLFEDLKLDWMVLGVAKCGTTSLQFNLGIHPEATLKSTHSNTFSHALLYSSSRFLPVHELQREFVSKMPSGLLGHPDWYKGNRSIGDIRGRQRSRRVGCSLVADLTPAYEDGTGNILSSLADPDAMPERFLYPFLLSTVLKAKPHLKMLYAAGISSGDADAESFWLAQATLAKAFAPRPIRILSVDGGHCALWLEPAISLQALFPAAWLKLNR
eukprot:Skav202302  [mRNA]  locus=scaffold60:64141:66249:+ [translate_table: standard]